MHRTWTICGVFLVAVAAAAEPAAADLVTVTNAIRSQGCGELSAVDQALRAQSDLDAAARHIAQGIALAKALSRSGYRARQSASIHIRTAYGDEGVANVLTQRFCDIVTDAGLREIGIYRRGKETWMVLAALFALENPDDAATVNQRVADLINKARHHARSCGRTKFAATRPLQQVAALEAAARAHARDMAAQNYLGHEGSDRSMPGDRVTRAGYAWSTVAENVAAGQTTAEAVVETWLQSAGHCANLMNPRYSETGVAHAVSPAGEKGIYWVQVYAAPE